RRRSALAGPNLAGPDLTTGLRTTIERHAASFRTLINLLFEFLPGTHWYAYYRESINQASQEENAPCTSNLYFPAMLPRRRGRSRAPTPSRPGRASYPHCSLCWLRGGFRRFSSLLLYLSLS